MVIVKRLVRVLMLMLLSTAMLSLNGCTHTVTSPVAMLCNGKLLYSMAIVAYTDNVTAEERDSIRSGMSMWSSASDQGVTYSEVSLSMLDTYLGKTFLGKCVPVIMYDSVKSSHYIIVVQDKKYSKQTLGLTIRSPCSLTRVWLVNDRIKNDLDRTRVAAHEFGHTLGLKHVNNDTSIMYETYSAKKSHGCITLDDAKELCVHLSCTVDNVMHCD